LGRRPQASLTKTVVKIKGPLGQGEDHIEALKKNAVPSGRIVGMYRMRTEQFAWKKEKRAKKENE